MVDHREVDRHFHQLTLFVQPQHLLIETDQEKSPPILILSQQWTSNGGTTFAVDIFLKLLIRQMCTLFLTSVLLTRYNISIARR